MKGYGVEDHVIPWPCKIFLFWPDRSRIYIGTMEDACQEKSRTLTSIQVGDDDGLPSTTILLFI
jgi:hypothetical protein